MVVVRVLAAVVGALMVLATLASAVQTVVVPRARLTRLTWIHFVGIRMIVNLFTKPNRPYSARDRILAAYAPIALVALPGAWVTVVILGFSLLFWASGVDGVAEAIAVSGSSLTTLGFERPPGLGREILSVIEAAIGLGLVALMISYLPTIYAAFQRREARVGGLQVRAGRPPAPAKLYRRYVLIGWLDRLGDDIFGPWEDWFVDIEESHTSQPALVFFRSPNPDRSWITAAGCVLDAAALHNAVVDLPHDPRADILLRSGFLALRQIAMSFGIPYDPDPGPDDPIRVTRDEFDAVCEELRDAGVPLVDDLDQGWRDFAGWRVNYDSALVGLAAMIVAPPAPWSSDREVPRVRTSFIRRRP